MTKISAHSGCENTVSGSKDNILCALNYKADLIEVDLQGFENKIYLSHDVVHNPDGLLTLQDAINLVKDTDVIFNCDIKNVRTSYAIISILKENDFFDRVVFTGDPDFQLLEEYGVKYYKNFYVKELFCKDNYDTLVSFYNTCKKSENFLGFNIDYRYVNRDLIDFFNKNTMKCCLWTIDDKEVFDMYYGLVDCITTNNIAHAASKRM